MTDDDWRRLQELLSESINSGKPDKEKNKGCYICPEYEHCTDAFRDNAVHCNNYAHFD